MVHKNYIYLLIALFLTHLAWASVPSRPSYLVMLDPGHGGSDCGARAIINKKKVCEKDLTLKIAKEIAKALRKENIEVILTRENDREIELEKRAELAEQKRADLFVSIHLNSHHSRKGNGFETYYLDNHTDLAVKKIEEIENQNLKGKQLEVNTIINDFIISHIAPDSKILADNIHRRVKTSIKKYKRSDRGIKPALFYVLALNKRPSVLLEAGFLSHKKESKLISSQKFMSKYAAGVATGIKKYFEGKNKNQESFEEVPLF